MKIFRQLNQKTFLLIMVGSVLLFVVASSAYGIWPQVKDIKTGLMTRNELRALVTSKEQLDEQKIRLSK